jgi:hypothetical protein
MSETNEPKINIEGIILDCSIVYSFLKDHPDPSVRECVSRLRPILGQAAKAIYHLHNIAERAIELEDRKILLPCSMLGLLERKNDKAGEV